ncbi:glycosyl transferase [Prauserella marina]|uniref:4-amino-4-deoxy-L-arabinose transferase n=1 Tax=Prauserella marina TaxID=530584 RepID=A0A222VMR9_9PSEU|nr:glycosyltransferase family 39 protein [Prauserella marina]ASR35043.1 glycosyl transferase [Prauserella marina]PWV85218.1 4-amino-4-deoxy-L-arabinose transferase-like glycosyltransferase [Prauserella marina]SDC02126.1 4-amino-4-deoxy-L-arabinose transferase [Prauserella marina]
MTTVLTAPAQDKPPARRGSRRHRRERQALAALLLATGLLYLWNLTASGFGNEYYAAAVQAGTQSWKAWLFGSLDAGNVVTVDKPPASLWVTTAFARLFGFSSFTVLAPQALMGVGAVWLLNATVRRSAGPVPALLAAAAFALTPVAALMFRYNNPDALLVLLLIAGAYCVVRATENASPRWLALAGAAIGFAFLTKMLQAFLVLPAFVLVYLVAAPATLGKRLAHLLGAAAAVAVSAGWFIALVDLWPQDARPYIGGSTDNSMLELAIGYNGAGRLIGGSGFIGGAPGGGTGGGGSFGGDAGLTRLFGAGFGPEISWLLPAALIGLCAGLWFTRRAGASDGARTALLLWGGWIVVTGAVFSFMGGIVHPYYGVALAPALAAVTAISGHALWRGRHNRPARLALAAMVAATGVWAFVLLPNLETAKNDAPGFVSLLRWTLLVLTVLVASALAAGAHGFRRFTTVLAASAVLVTGLGSGAYALATAAAPHGGSIPSSGPENTARSRPDGESPSDGAVTALLSTTNTTWAAATQGAQAASRLAIGSGKAVLGIGGWSGNDPAPTLAEFQRYVAEGRIGYYLASAGQTGGTRGPTGSSEIATWVAAHFTPTHVGGQTVYDLRP